MHKISRSKIDLFVECPRCFWLDQVKGVKRPSGPAFTLNSAVDHLLKKEFDIHRAHGTAHPLMQQYGIDAVPLQHEKLDQWRHNFTGVRFEHTPTGLLVFGAVDDVWKTPDGTVHVVDYKATAKDAEVELEDTRWHNQYRRQLEVYQWLLRGNGLNVSDTGYFVYVNGRKDLEAFDGRLEFRVKIIPYTGNTTWIEPTLEKISACLRSSAPPDAAPHCEHCRYRAAAMGIET